MYKCAILLLLVGLACCLLPQQTAAHGYLAQPVSRNLYARRQNTFYDEMSGNGLGFGNTNGPGAQQQMLHCWHPHRAGRSDQLQTSGSLLMNLRNAASDTPRYDVSAAAASPAPGMVLQPDQCCCCTAKHSCQASDRKVMTYSPH